MPPELPHNRTRVHRSPSASITIQHGGAIVSAPRVPEARGRGFVTPPLHHHVPGRDLLGDLTTRLDLRAAKLPGLLQIQPELRRRPEVPGQPYSPQQPQLGSIFSSSS